MSRFEKKGFSMCGAKLVHVNKKFAEQHYIDLKKKPFYGGINLLQTLSKCMLRFD